LFCKWHFSNKIQISFTFLNKECQKSLACLCIFWVWLNSQVFFNWQHINNGYIQPQSKLFYVYDKWLSTVILFKIRGTCELELHMDSVNILSKLIFRDTHQAELMRARTRTDLASHAQRTQQTINPDVRAPQSWANMSMSKPNPREQCSHARKFHCRSARPGMGWSARRAAHHRRNNH
jgi:hypothetical protein